eukprot:2479280-Amphidinium_carterae.1
MASCKDSCEGGAGSVGLSAPAHCPFDLPRLLLLPFPLPVPPFCGGLRDGLGAPHARHVPRVAKLFFPHAQFQSSREGLLELLHGGCSGADVEGGCEKKPKIYWRAASSLGADCRFGLPMSHR